MRERKHSLVIADDHPMVLEGLKALLEPSYEVVGTATDGAALLDLIETRRPELVITDIAMPEIDGIEVTRRLQATAPEVRILVLSIHAEPSWVRAAFEAGAHAYLTKTSAPDEIETAVREVLKGRCYVSPVVAWAVVGQAAQFRPPEDETGEVLTRRELEIVRLVGTGIGNKEIARQLGVSVATVRTHLSNAYGKLGPTTRVELALYAARTAGPPS